MSVWAHMGGDEAAAEYQVYLLSNTFRATNNQNQPQSQTPAPAANAVSQYPDIPPADQPGPGAMSQGQYQYVDHSLQSPSRAASPAASSTGRSRSDGESAMYHQLPSFPPFDAPIPDEATIEEICIRYPNHLRGEYLDAFIQWMWTANQIHDRLTKTALEEINSTGISRSKSVNNRANFLMKRLDARMNRFTEEQMAALCLAPNKLRGCLMNGGVTDGRNKMQGKFHNENASLIRSTGRAQTAAAAERTVMLGGKEYRLWQTEAELETFNRGIATRWNRQRQRAEEIINADATYDLIVSRGRRNLIMRMTNWPFNPSTETMFSFLHVEACPAFIRAMGDLVAEHVVHMFDSCQPPGRTVDQKVVLTRKSAEDYVKQAYAARLSRLEKVVAKLPAEGLVKGLVDDVLSWNGDGAQEGDLVMDEPQLLENPSDGNTATAHDYAAGPDDPSDGNTVAALQHATATGPHEFVGNPFDENTTAAHEYAIGANELYADSTAMDLDSAAGPPPSMLLRPTITPKRAREEPTQQLGTLKRRCVQPSITPEAFRFEASTPADTTSYHARDMVAATSATTDQYATQIDADIARAAGASMISDIMVINNGRCDHAVSTSAPTWHSSMPTGAVSQKVPQQEVIGVGADTVLDQAPGTSQSPSTCSAADVVFTLEVPPAELRKEFDVGDFASDVSGFEEPNTGAVGTVTQSGAASHAVTGVNSVGTGHHNGAGGVVNPGDNSSDFATWDLPDMIDNDEDWLKESVAEAFAMGPPDLEEV
ncbi:hypothetical protein A1O7_09556 [Cladophialophora yegresii CBS 114405]|uniref:Uncharacterized protein n=1 Tax=Cladophialophora yegresii CBS 114405 TaxID=1182544 RepID=W9W6P3_9EURO|nr:uncharacterized protein A1O7_09556 [Cladophialophora yegresii CBS 114405]EXJ54219.1 hypothetical protein A1O7_09556 [Cladophialophora yegresii CBS 114405]